MIKSSASFWKSTFGDALQKALVSIGIGAGISGGLAGTAFMIDKYRKHNREVKMPMYFDSMLLRNPDIAEKYRTSKEDKAIIQDYFKLLEDYSPKVVENPTAAGSFIRKLYEYKDLGPDISLIETLSKITKNYADTDKGGLSKGVISGFYDTGVGVAFPRVN